LIITAVAIKNRNAGGNGTGDKKSGGVWNSAAGVYLARFWEPKQS